MLTTPPPPATADEAIAQLLRVHLGLDDATASSACGYRAFFALPWATPFRAKQRLLRLAADTACSGVILDVLLFVSQTMATELLFQELVAAPVLMDHWVNYMAQQCVINRESTVFSVRGIIDLYINTQRYVDLATQLLALIMHEPQLDKSLRVAREVADILRQYRHVVPLWALDALDEFIALTELQCETEARDAATAPLEQRLSAYLDKRSRGKGANALQANWRRRYVELTAREITYSKHDANTLAQSKNPFLDKRTKGSVQLRAGLAVEPHDYVGKVSKKPYCVQVGTGDHALILDAGTVEVQAEWLAAIRANVARVDLDPVWTRHPRKSVLRLTMAEFFRYALLYHNHDRAPQSCRPDTIRARFQLDDKRCLHDALAVHATKAEWDNMEDLAQPVKPKMLFGLPGSSDPVFIGYGPILDMALAYGAPVTFVELLETLYAKHDKKERVWSCRKYVDAEANASDAIHVHIPESMREAQWD